MQSQASQHGRELGYHQIITARFILMAPYMPARRLWQDGYKEDERSPIL
jgi:hypothetical protein